MLYKVNVYNLTHDTKITDKDIMDYIIVEKRNDKIREAVSDRAVIATVDSKVMESDISTVNEYRSTVGVVPCIKLEDLIDENRIDYDVTKGYNAELTEYVVTYDDRFFTKFNRKRGEFKKNQKEKQFVKTI